MGSATWYREGLRFACTQCGHCCRVEGYVWVDRDNINKIAGFLDIAVDDFIHTYVRRVDGRLSLVEKASYECIFWSDGCTIYPVRPTQCRTFPFWKENLRSAAAWRATAADCEGIDQGEQYDAGEIDALAGGRGTTADNNEQLTDPAGSDRSRRTDLE